MPQMVAVGQVRALVRQHGAALGGVQTAQQAPGHDDAARPTRHRIRVVVWMVDDHELTPGDG